MIDDSKELILSDLEDGVYYSRVIKYTGSDEIALLNEPVITEHIVSKGMVYLEGIKYGETLKVTEVKAPEGFYFDDPYFEINVTNDDYTINFIEADRINNAIVIITPTGIGLHEIRPLLYGVGAILVITIAGLIIYRKRRFSKR